MRKTKRYYKYLYIPASLALLTLLFVCFFSALPVMAAPAFRLNPSSGAVGTTVTLTGAVFDSYEGDSIHILFDTTEIENSPIIIPAEGSFSITYSIPADAAPGLHTFGAKRETNDSTFFISAPFTIDARALTLNIVEGAIETDITISGTGFYINEGVTINYFNPEAVNIGTVTASSSGKFTKSYTIPAGTVGFHKFYASNVYGNTAEAFFKVLPVIMSSLDSGAPGELLIVRGSGFGTRTNIILSLGTTNVASVAADDLGRFETEFTIPEIERSTYFLKALDNLGNKAELEFSVTAGAALSEKTGSVGTPLTVTGSGFDPGATVTIYYDDEPITTAETDDEGNFTITIIVPISSGGTHIIKITDNTVNSITRQYPFIVESAPPPSPVLLLPDNNSITSASTHFRWEAIIDTSIPVTYSLEISTDTGFSAVTLQKTGLADTRYDLAGEEALAVIPAGSMYFWRVMAIDGAGNRSAWSGIQAFFVDSPDAPILSQPALGTAVAFPIGLSWGTSESLSPPVSYNIQVSRNPEFSQLLIDEKGLALPGYTITAEHKRIFNKKIPYYWRVKAVDNARNASGWSGTGSFSIASSGFPAWAVYTIISFAAVVLALLAYRFSRRKRYH